MKLLAFGILSWDGAERRGRRYGQIVCDGSDYGNKAEASPTFDKDTFSVLENKTVRLVAEIVEARPSGHIGDAFLGIKPSTPSVGDRIEIGVGTLVSFGIPFGKELGFGIAPADGREELWMDPRILFRLHDQTVNIYVEETTDPHSPAPDLAFNGEGSINNGDGSFQISSPKARTATGARVLPSMTKLGDGLFAVDFDKLKVDWFK
jgi:hypothetical protein